MNALNANAVLVLCGLFLNTTKLLFMLFSNSLNLYLYSLFKYNFSRYKGHILSQRETDVYVAFPNCCFSPGYHSVCSFQKIHSPKFEVTLADHRLDQRYKLLYAANGMIIFFLR